MGHVCRRLKKGSLNKYRIAKIKNLNFGLVNRCANLHIKKKLHKKVVRALYALENYYATGITWNEGFLELIKK